MSTDYYTAEDWHHGLRCAACHKHFVEGQPISQRLDSMADEIPVCVVICVGCAMSGEAIANK